MQYGFQITAGKALTQVIVHAEVYRETDEFPFRVKLMQWTELLDEEAHPEPQKWMMQHVMGFLETLP